jgi:hypothetical protein
MEEKFGISVLFKIEAHRFPYKQYVKISDLYFTTTFLPVDTVEQREKFKIVCPSLQDFVKLQLSLLSKD